MMDPFGQPEDMQRRVFIKGLGCVSLGLIFSTMLGGCESLLEQIKNRPVRRRLRTGSAKVDDVIAIYKDAVTQMKALPNSDPRSWAAQAALHGSVSGGFNFCQHGTNHFFSWHRAYLFYFEQICKELTGEKDFGLPYWNWNQNPAMHAEFTNAGSPLLHPRNNTSVAGNAAFSDTTMDTIFADSNFFTFSTQIEGTPHNTAHVVVGGDMVTGGSPLDPVFWAHHCMVDYCWAKWNIELENDNTNDAAWINTSWNHFVNASGDPVEVTAGITTLMPFLSYRYESSAVGGFAAAMDLTARSEAELKKIEKRLKQGADIRFDIKKRVPIAKGTTLTIAKPYSVQTRVSAEDFNALIESDQREERVFINVNYVRLPPVNDFYVRVFINLPDASVQTRTDDTHYAGSFAFFGVHTDDHRDHGEHHGKTDFLVNITETLKKLKRLNKLSVDAPLSVQLVAVPTTKQFIRPDMELALEEIEFIVSPVIVRSK
jgi:tyrosinase